MVAIPKGRFTAHAHDSRAPYLDGPPRSVVSALTNAEAAIRGLIENPLNPFRRRNELLAEMERGLDIDISGGARLRALDAVDGHFHIHVTPRSLDDGYSLTISLAEKGDESNAIVRTNPHAPDAPVGFYNLSSSREAIDGVRKVLVAARDDTRTSAVNVLRAKAIIARLDIAGGFLSRMEEAKPAHPELDLLPKAAKLAYEVKKAGDATDQALSATVSKIEKWLDQGAGGLASDLVAQVREDLDTIAADRKKWIAWRASTGLFKLWVPMD